MAAGSEQPCANLTGTTSYISTPYGDVLQVWVDWNSSCTSSGDSDAWRSWSGSSANTTTVGDTWTNWTTASAGPQVVELPSGYRVFDTGNTRYIGYSREKDRRIRPAPAVRKPTLEEMVSREIQLLQETRLDAAHDQRAKMVAEFGEEAVAEAEQGAEVEMSVRWLMQQTRGQQLPVLLSSIATDWRSEANRRAEELLRTELTEQQRKDLDEMGSFFVEVGQRLYAIRRGRSMNILEVDPKEPTRQLAKFCIHPEVGCPDADSMLAQKILLETDEREFLRVANRF